MYKEAGLSLRGRIIVSAQAIITCGFLDKSMQVSGTVAARMERGGVITSSLGGWIVLDK